LRRDKKKFTAVKARNRHHGISDAPRVKKANYPIEMQEIA
jgi:hypothetical protein